MPSEVRRAIESMPATERWGSLCFFGEWFGRPYDNQHTLVDVSDDESPIVLTFDDGETLAVWDPARVSLAADGLRIGRASRVRWEWFAYGRPKTPENRFSIDYRVESGGGIAVTYTADGNKPHHRPDPTADAVGFLKLVLS